jgi:hypothetical protein
MPNADTTLKHPTCDPETTSYRGDSTRMLGEGTEPELKFVNRISVVALNDLMSNPPMHFRNVSEPQKWHTPYAEALMCGDSTKVHAAITLAQRAILSRYLELTAGSETQPEEAADLANAVDVLQALGRTAQHPLSH